MVSFVWCCFVFTYLAWNWEMEALVNVSRRVDSWLHLHVDGFIWGTRCDISKLEYHE